MSWEFGKEITNDEEYEEAKKFFIHCLYREYDDMCIDEMTVLRESINKYEKGKEKCQ